MSVKLACPTCGHIEKVDDEDEGTARCPDCDEVLIQPKPRARAAADDEGRTAKRRPATRHEDDEEDDHPRRKGRRDRDDEDQEDERPARRKPKTYEVVGQGEGSNPQDGRVAEELELPTGFADEELIRQVEKELGRGEVLHFACRPSEPIARWRAICIGLVGILVATIGGSLAAAMFANGSTIVGVIGCILALVGAAVAVLGPRAKLKQAATGYYAVTNNRAIVSYPSLLGSLGTPMTYTPAELQRMRFAKSKFMKEGGDLIFLSQGLLSTQEGGSGRGRSRSAPATGGTGLGFVGIERVKVVQTLVRDVLVPRDDAEED